MGKQTESTTSGEVTDARMNSLTERQQRARLLLTAAPRTLVKLCGMYRPQDIVAANAAAPDMVGFIIGFPKSHRCVSRELLDELANAVDETIARVGVFVNAPCTDIVNLVSAGVIDVVQLHGSEDNLYIEKLRSHTAVGIIQALKVASPTDVARAEASTADVVLLDSGQGSGERFDWSLAPHLQRPYLLAGGLTPQNLEEALSQTHPLGVDLSSGIETNRIKDPSKMRAAVQAVRKYTKGT